MGRQNLCRRSGASMKRRPNSVNMLYMMSKIGQEASGVVCCPGVVLKSLGGVEHE
jgi:hypothetical protein